MTAAIEWDNNTHAKTDNLERTATRDKSPD